MAQPLAPTAPPAARLNLDPDDPAIRSAREDLAACFRAAARLGMHESVCNHFSLMIPGRDDLFLVNPYGISFAEVTASRLLLCDFDGNVLAGEGQPEATAHWIHARLHRMRPTARAAFHTHMPHTTALCMIELPDDLFVFQSMLKFKGRLAVDPHYGGLALDAAEGDRIAAAMGNADIVLMHGHGPMVVGPTAAAAWDDLFFLERAAQTLLLALSSGRKLVGLDSKIAEVTAAAMREERLDSAALHLASIKRQLDVTEPGWRH
jgi:ribulose-5-phosphate 4-epimerase/fuculose-1-phosphate aldolase